MILGWSRNRSRYDLHKYFFTKKIVNTWNSLRNDVVLCNTVNKFKSYLDKYQLNQILFMIIKLKFMEPETEVHITRTSYVGYQYFVSLVFVIRA